MMQRGGVIALLLAVGLLAAGCNAATQSASKNGAPKPSATTTEIEALDKAPISYLGATSSLDRFLGAWLSGNVSLAKTFLTPAQRKVLDEGEARDTFLGRYGGQPAAFEVIGSQQVSASEYQFKVWIYRFVPGAFGSDYAIPRAKPDLVIVQREGSTWLVAAIPKQILRR